MKKWAEVRFRFWKKIHIMQKMEQIRQVLELGVHCYLLLLQVFLKLDAEMKCFITYVYI